MVLSRAAPSARRPSKALPLKIVHMLPELILAIAAGTFALLLTVADRFERQRTAVRVTTNFRRRSR
jgi:hypothetical protein